MYQFFVEPEAIKDHTVIITGSDVNHIKNVLRMKVGEELAVSNGVDGNEYRCAIANLTEDAVVCDLLFVKEDGVELSSKIYLFQGLPKADKMELIIQKAVELGVYEVIPVAMKRCVMKLDAKKEKNKRTRWQAIAEAAAKQSKRAIVPNIAGVMSYKEAVQKAKELDVVLLPYEMAEDMEYTRNLMAEIKPGQSIGIFIGPEGGFADEEVSFAKDAGAKVMTLGKRILRTETAGMTVLSILMYELEARV